jgi:hypothetical protein
MNQTCDRCGPAVRAAYRASRGGQLYLCGHCTVRMRPALSAQGWDIWPMAAPAVMPLGPPSPGMPRESSHPTQ